MSKVSKYRYVHGLCYSWYVDLINKLIWDICIYRNLDNIVGNLARNFAEGTEYFKVCIFYTFSVCTAFRKTQFWYYCWISLKIVGNDRKNINVFVIRKTYFWIICLISLKIVDTNWKYGEIFLMKYCLFEICCLFQVNFLKYYIESCLCRSKYCILNFKMMCVTDLYHIYYIY